MTLELATALGAAVTAYLVGYINRTALEILFAVFLLYGAITILRKGGKTEDVRDEDAQDEEESAPATTGNAPLFPPYEPKRYPLGMGASLVAGGLSGLLGIGGGPIKVPDRPDADRGLSPAWPGFCVVAGFRRAERPAVRSPGS